MARLDMCQVKTNAATIILITTMGTKVQLHHTPASTFVHTLTAINTDNATLGNTNALPSGTNFSGISKTAKLYANCAPKRNFA